ncbi:MAG: SMC family ATPase [Chloroflexi bacterium]|nr:SMC family ATPase [Chloroflexota bacterium]
MLPISLTLRNFLSYRDAAPTLRLEDVHLVCLCGPNGHGKSALLDAITWVLWGNARGLRGRHGPLLHHGQDEMFVELEFDVRDERYRVTRRYSQARRSPQSSLELAVRSGDDYQPITGDTIDQTQAHIIRIINMDYDTFVNSAFLVQGRADQFTMSTPAARKEVLSRVLGLGLYDRLEERAKLRSRELQAVLSSTAGTMDVLRERAAQAEGLREELAEAGRELAAAAEAAASAAERLSLLRARVEQLERWREEATGLDEQARRVAARQREAAADAETIERRVGEWRSALSDAAGIEAGVAALERAREQYRAVSTAAQQVATLQRELAPLDEAVITARAGFESDAAAQNHHISHELAPRADALPAVEQRRTEVASETEALAASSADAEKAEEEHRRLSLEARQLEQANALLAEQGKETKAKLDLLDHGHEEGVPCPLCGTALGEASLERIQTAYREEIEEQRTRFGVQQTRVKVLDKQAEDLAVLAAKARQALDASRRELDVERVALDLRLDESRRAAAQIEGARRVLAEAEAALASGAYAAGEQAAAKALRERIAALAYDAHAFEAAEAQVTELTPWETRAQALVQARTRLDEDAVALDGAKRRVAEADEELARVGAQQQAIAADLKGLPGAREERDVAQTVASAAEPRRDEARAAQAALAYRLDEAEAAGTELTKQETAHRDLVQEAGVYSELALAFGKGGVQALLIEAAIPRLEDEANELLKRMTNGEMTLKIETQRARRTGPGADGSDAVETLDIQIADGLGTRAYEMFSGGERFRIDFAIRIALSKLLAWRAGAPLPTLFIDEGFGTQDAEGRDRILDVIRAIQDRFERILVITHMEEMKDAFPLRIEVSRTAEGSTFTMS